jgi:hypothetical protein
MARTKQDQREYNARPDVRAKRIARTKQWHLDNPERSKYLIRKSHLKKKFGITVEEYDRMFAEQGRCCAICGGTKSFAKRDGHFHVDHCHKTGKIRGILCQACNVTLGKMDERPDLLRLAADYLEKHQ